MRAAKFVSTAKKDGIRLEACPLLGMCVRGLIMEGSTHSGKMVNVASILKKMRG